MTRTEMIAKLKDPKQAQPYWMRTKEEQGILFKAGPENTLMVSQDLPQGWKHGWELSEWCEQLLILKPDYEPESEYEDIDVVNNGHYCVLGKVPGNSSNTCVYMHVCNRRFLSFVRIEDHVAYKVETDIEIGEVATAIHEGHMVVARFRKE